MPGSISVITPSFNQGRFIERTIKSVLAQNVADLEYVVIDGGSTDETLTILKKHGDAFSWVSEKDRGHSDAINKGIVRTTAPIVGWLNSDDIYYPDALSKVVDYFGSHPDTEVVYGDAYHIDKNDVVLEQYPTEEWDWERLKEVCFISQPAAFVRRNIFERYGVMDLSLRQSMDYEFWLRLGKNHVQFAHIPQVLAATRLHSDAFTVAAKVACHRAINDLTRQHLGRTPDQWLYNYAHAVMESKNIRRDRRFFFAAFVSLTSMGAALRWNKRISPAMLKTTVHWMGGTAKITVSEALGQ